jgi:AraC-like DNA-binding protein
MRHGAREVRPRHCHAAPFAALVLTGGYVEAGDRGRHAVQPGDVLFHDAFEAHMNLVGRAGAEVLILPPCAGWPGFAAGRVADPDLVVTLARTRAGDAATALVETVRETAAAVLDWPDLLAGDLRADPSLCLGAWAREKGLTAAGVSHGFRRCYGVAPRRYRATARARRALAAIQASASSLADVALQSGFFDQAHMTRSVSELTGQPPASWRKPCKGEHVFRDGSP